MTVRPAFEPPLREEPQEAGRLVLRDGSRLPVWRVLEPRQVLVVTYDPERRSLVASAVASY